MRELRLPLLQRTARSNRVRFGIFTSALSSLGGFTVAVAFSHRMELVEFGHLAICLAVIAIVVGFVHASVCEPLIASVDHWSGLKPAIRRASFVGLLASVVVATYGGLSEEEFLLWGGISIQGIVLYDLAKTANLAVGLPRRAAGWETTYFACSLAVAGSVLFDLIPAMSAFAVWSVCGAALGYAACVQTRFLPMPVWQTGPVSTPTAMAFGFDFLIGSGSSQLLSTMLGAIGQVAVVGALRAAGTLMGPVTLGLGLARTLLIPYFTRARTEGLTNRSREALRITALMAALAAPPLSFVALLPSEIGELLLGQNWQAAQPLLPFFAFEAFCSVLATVPFAGHRAYLAAGRSLAVRSVLSCIRVAAIICAAQYFGAVAAAAAMAVSALVGAAAWWISYATLSDAKDVR